MTKFHRPSGEAGDAVNGIRRMDERCDEIALLHLGVAAAGDGNGDVGEAVSRQGLNRDVNCDDRFLSWQDSC